MGKQCTSEVVYITCMDCGCQVEVLKNIRVRKKRCCACATIKERKMLAEKYQRKKPRSRFTPVMSDTIQTNYDIYQAFKPRENSDVDPIDESEFGAVFYEIYEITNHGHMKNKQYKNKDKKEKEKWDDEVIPFEEL